MNRASKTSKAQSSKLPHATANDLAEGIRGQMIPLLQARLGDAIDLHYQAKQAHWNVKGPSFFHLHELFDKIAEEADEYTDLIAERLVQLGGQAHGTIRSASARTTLPEYPLDLSAGMDHCQSLSRSLSAFAHCVREAIDTSSDTKDADTADIFTEISRGVDKSLWFVEAHLQADR